MKDEGGLEPSSPRLTIGEGTNRRDPPVGTRKVVSSTGECPVPGGFFTRSPLLRVGVDPDPMEILELSFTGYTERYGKGST